MEPEEGEELSVDETYQHAYPCKKTLLTAIEEKTLCEKAQNGDESAREQMILFNLRLVIRIASRYKGKSLDLEDLVQEGVIGLMTAVEKYDTMQNWRFSTYATYWIRQSIVRAMEKRDRKIRVPAYLYQLERRMRQAEQRFVSQWGREPTQEEVLAEAGLPGKTLRTLGYLQQEPLSLDTLMGVDQDSTLADLLEDSSEVNPEAIAMQQVNREELLTLLCGLTERERIVIERRYGFYDGSVWTLAGIARLLGVSREAIRQTQERALRRLRVMAAEGETEDDLSRGSLQG
jgi:RNA polymerase primary sigma factor